MSSVEILLFMNCGQSHTAILYPKLAQNGEESFVSLYEVYLLSSTLTGASPFGNNSAIWDGFAV